jgi:hypothetical protein
MAMPWEGFFGIASDAVLLAAANATTIFCSLGREYK